jgi:hypothetical protein
VIAMITTSGLATLYARLLTVGCWALLVKNVVAEWENRMPDFLKLECTRKTKVLRRLQTMVALASIVEAMILARG